MILRTEARFGLLLWEFKSWQRRKYLDYYTIREKT